MKKNLINSLFSKKYKTYVILDGAVTDKVSFNVNHIFSINSLSLYLGKDTENLEEVAPYLVELSETNKFTNWVLDGYGNGYSLFFHSTYDLTTIHSVLSPLTKIIDEETGDNVFVRFYDPRVFQKYLKIQTKEQCEALFSIIPIFLYENYDNTFELCKTTYFDQLLETKYISVKGEK